MLHYNVTFIKSLLSANGQTFKCVQEVIPVDADSASEAIRSAKRVFERQRCVSHWRVHADTVETTEVAEARAQAGETRDPQARRPPLKISSDYEILAKRAQERKRRAQRDKCGS